MRNKHHGEQLIDDIRVRRAAGQSCSAIGKIHDMTENAVRCLCRYHGIRSTKTPGIDNRKYSAEQELQIKQLRMSEPELTYQQIGARLNIPWPTVSTVLRRHGLQRSRQEVIEGKARQVAVTAAGKRSVADVKIDAQWHPTLNGVEPAEVSYGSKREFWFVCPNGHEFQARPNSLSAPGRPRGCARCSYRVSRAQQEIYQWLIGLGVKADINAKGHLPDAKELDIWVPERRFAIEYQGLYWHSSAAPGFKRNREANKYWECQAAGIQLFTVFEDEWRDKPAVVKSMIKHRLGIKAGTSVYARRCEVEQVDGGVARAFFDSNHLEGHVPATQYWALLHGDRPVAMASLRKHFTGEHELARLATAVDHHSPGAASRLLNLLPRPLISFSNNRIGRGAVYAGLGFTEVTASRVPGYFYTDGKVRVPRFRCRRINDPAVLAEYPTEELQNAAGLQAEAIFGKRKPMYRIEDCGHRKWRLP